VVGRGSIASSCRRCRWCTWCRLAPSPCHPECIALCLLLCDHRTRLHDRGLYASRVGAIATPARLLCIHHAFSCVARGWNEYSASCHTFLYDETPPRRKRTTLDVGGGTVCFSLQPLSPATVVARSCDHATPLIRCVWTR
jgi:hypothetical protein